MSIQDGNVLVTFSFKKFDHQDQKSLFEATSLEILNDNHPFDDVFLLLVYFLLLLLDGVSIEKRKLNAFITDYTKSRFIIYKNARYVPFVQCLVGMPLDFVIK